MRFGMLIAAIAALWVQPARAALFFDTLSVDFENDVAGLSPDQPDGLDLLYSPVVEAGGPTGNFVRLLTVNHPTPTAILNTYFVKTATQNIQTEFVSFDVMATRGGKVSGALGDPISLVPGEWTHISYPTSPNYLANFIVKLHARSGEFHIDNLLLRQSFVPVPEPSTWILMILGFGAIGAAIRRKHQPHLSRTS